MTTHAHKRTCLVFTMALLALAPEIASANILDNFGTAMLNVLNNNFLRAVATIAVIGTDPDTDVALTYVEGVGNERPFFTEPLRDFSVA